MSELWRVEVDGSLCVGSAMCVHLAAEHFEPDAGTRSHPRLKLAEYSQGVADPAALCPAGAISYSPAFTDSAVTDCAFTDSASELGSETEYSQDVADAAALC